MDSSFDDDIVELYELAEAPDVPEIDEPVEVQDIPEVPSGSSDITIHPGRGFEFEPLPETEPITVPGQKGEAGQPPEEWHPGGPEGGG